MAAHPPSRAGPCRWRAGMISPAERRVLLALLSVVRDREPDPDEWPSTDVPLPALYDRYEVRQPHKPHSSLEFQQRDQRRTMRRALCQLLDEGLISAVALAWRNVESGINIEGEQLVRSQEDGPLTHEADDPLWFRAAAAAPRWRTVSLTPAGVAIALALEGGDDR
jgi:hypothetical protein